MHGLDINTGVITECIGNARSNDNNSDVLC